MYKCIWVILKSCRWHELAENHDEMIKIKDDYKRRNVDLTAENARLREDNAKLFSKAIQERDATIGELQKKLNAIKEQSSAMDKQNRWTILMKYNIDKTI